MLRHLRLTGNIVTYRMLVFGLCAGVFVTPAPQTALAADLAEQAHSLNMAPADSAFYSTSLRLKEQWEKFLGSNAYDRLMEIPVIQLAKMQVAFQWQQSQEPTLAKIREYIQSSQGQDAVGVLKEMFAEEVFVYGAGDVADAFKLFMELNAVRRTVRLEALAKGENPDEAMKARVLEILKSHADEFKVPTMVFGFRIKDGERANRELDEVHSLIRNVLDEHQPDLAAHLERDQIAGHEFLTFRVDGSMIPWDKVREQADEMDDEDFDKWRELISAKTVAVALGVIDEYVLLSVGESTDHLENMGKGPFLSEQPAMKRLEKHADQKVVSLSYMSKAFARSMSSAQHTIEDIAGGIEEALGAAEVSEEHRKQIVEDIRSFDLKKFMPEPGEATGIAYLTARGYEGFRYGSAQLPMMDSSKPLSILKHVGGSPALVFATRSNDNVGDYETIVAWLKRISGHVEQIVEEKADPEEWARYQKYRGKGIELLKRLDTATREHLYPALADGQGALVMDLSATNKQWFDQMPEGTKPLAIPELAFVAAVSDAERLRQGVTEYIDVLRDALKLAHEIDPDNTPQVKLPKAQVRELEGGKMYVYPLPKEWGVEKGIAINAGLTDTVAVVSTMPATTERLTAETSPDLDTSLQLDRPAAVVAHINFEKFIGATRPWIDYGFDVAMGKIKPKKDDDDADDEEESNPAAQNPMMLQLGFIVPQVHQFLDVASVLRSATSVTYEEDGLWVTHSETHIEDLK